MGLKMLTQGCILVILGFIHNVQPHGRLIEPPSRSTMWRYGFNTPPNYNDHELYCGGFSRQWKTNGGKCGICGDPWDIKPPRPNEAGGLYGKGIIVRKYEKNSIIKVRVELTANHMGYFEFRICPNNNPTKPATQKCLDLYKLRSANADETRYFPGPGARVFEMHYQLPKGLTCRQCVFQWRYVAGNNWGSCPNGTEAVGCGPQEEFRACADIGITEPDGTANNDPNLYEDGDVFMPTDIEQPDDKGIKEVSTEEVPMKNATHEHTTTLPEDVAVEALIIAIFASILFSMLFFGCLFLYYTKYGQTWRSNREWPGQMPSLPASMPRAWKNVTSHISWPLSNMKNIKGLPSVWKNKMSSTTKEDQPRTASITAQMPKVDSDGGAPMRPQPPPRTKRPIAAVAPAAVRSVPQHPKVAPPPPPPTSASGLEIGTPLSVSINGISVMKQQPPPMASSLIVEEEEMSLPPPLPKSPPPIEDTQIQNP